MNIQAKIKTMPFSVSLIVSTRKLVIQREASKSDSRALILGMGQVDLTFPYCPYLVRPTVFEVKMPSGWWVGVHPGGWGVESD